MQTAANLIVASTIVAATELTIDWNNIKAVDDVSTAGQTIPLIVAAGLVANILYVALRREWSGNNPPGVGDRTISPRPPVLKKPDPMFILPSRMARS